MSQKDKQAKKQRKKHKKDKPKTPKTSYGGKQSIGKDKNKGKVSKEMLCIKNMLQLAKNPSFEPSITLAAHHVILTRILQDLVALSHQNCCGLLNEPSYTLGLLFVATKFPDFTKLKYVSQCKNCDVVVRCALLLAASTKNIAQHSLSFLLATSEDLGRQFASRDPDKELNKLESLEDATKQNDSDEKKSKETYMPTLKDLCLIKLSAMDDLGGVALPNTLLLDLALATIIKKLSGDESCAKSLYAQLTEWCLEEIVALKRTVFKLATDSERTQSAYTLALLSRILDDNSSAGIGSFRTYSWFRFAHIAVGFSRMDKTLRGDFAVLRARQFPAVRVKEMMLVCCAVLTIKMKYCEKYGPKHVKSYQKELKALRVRDSAALKAFGKYAIESEGEFIKTLGLSAAKTAQVIEKVRYMRTLT